ncbi:alpha/beta hydrolase [Halomonas daqiaonensis]|uniref:Alpha/beta hydrolase fold n=1 Tax=Halomonas daqiaonensis TaxID=650850 RepID=A0A1H7VZ81_9GAMM|nr:alpha/beta hydrolase [Halomonas daqiaonensis]SEM14374.1 alpha/beta hydrolase fold [Halomonas daqiaonensis]
MIDNKKWWLALGLSLLITGCATHLDSNGPVTASDVSESADYAFQRLAPLTYTPEDWPEALEAHVLLPDTPSGHMRPAALLVHGGGWQRRSPDDMEEIAERFAERGYVTVNIAYRFAPQYRFPAQLHDLQQAMAWIHERADEWRIDTDRIVGVGYSSGAHLVSLLGVSGNVEALTEPYGGEQTRLTAVLSGGLPSDLLKFDDGRLVVEFIGGTRAEKPEAYRLASPIYHVDDDTPPHFLFHGRWDSLVPVDHATDFHAELLAHGVKSELYLQHYRGHFTSFLTRGNAIEAGIAFLASLSGYATPAPTASSVPSTLADAPQP